MLEVAEDSLVDRVTGRRVDPVTGNIYHDKFNPPKSKIVANRLTQRCDDAEVTFAKRFCDFMTHKDGLQSWYSERALTVDASAAPFSVAHQILTAIDGDLFTSKKETETDSKLPSPISPTLFPSLQELYVKSAEKKDSPNSAVATTPNPMMSRSRAPPVSFVSPSQSDDRDGNGDGDRSSLFTYSPDMSVSGFDSARHVYLSPMMADSPSADSVLNISDEFQSPRSSYPGASMKSFKSSVAVRARIAALTEQHTFSTTRLLSSWASYIAQFPLLVIALQTITLSLLLHSMGSLIELRSSQQQQRGHNSSKRYGMAAKPSSFMQYALLSHSGGVDSGSLQHDQESETLSTTWSEGTHDSVTRTYFVAITARKCAASSSSAGPCAPTSWSRRNVYVRMIHDTADSFFSQFVRLLVELNGNVHENQDYF
jgi:hypothetical protein